ncbi:restriction endonuclease [Pusillimonas minor]|uniref:Restriction endonuclease n=1 Tax=Pusillimonas minor TaxID=2697024 RepID=A0A842HSA7_9BURK|nr:restriction endonuclease [Pusillimonas minor]MBC2770528.1 restriction endonuclease [Pusillimonas minor]
MSIPDFQTLMRPLLALHQDGHEHINRDLVSALADQFGLTEDDRRQMLPSGRARMFDNRVGWAKTYISNAGLIRAPRRGVSVITDFGARVLAEQAGQINLKFLAALSEDTSQKNDKALLVNDGVDAKPDLISTQETPEELFENAYSRMRADIERQLLARVMENPPEFLERIIVDLLVRMGYGGSRKDAGEAIGRSGDEGIDGIIKEDPLGLDIIYLQAKRYEGTVGRPDLQKFAGALQGQRAKKGIFITTSSYSREAKDYVTRIDAKIILIDGARLAGLMFDHGVGVSVNTVYESKRIDADYFDEA